MKNLMCMCIYNIYIIYNACLCITIYLYIYSIYLKKRKRYQFTSVRHTSSIKITPDALSSPGKMWSLSNFFSFTSHGVTVKPSLEVYLSSAEFLLVYLKITYISKQKVYIFPDVSSCSSVKN